MKRARIGAVVLMACLLAVGSASAIVLPYEFTVGNLDICVDFISFSNPPLDASDVDVTPVGSGVPGDWYGIQISGPFSTDLGLDGVLDVAFNYSVSTRDGRPLIHDIVQAFNLTATGSGGRVAIGESVFDAGYAVGNLVAQSTVSYYVDGADFSDPPGELFQGDHLILDNLEEQVWVTTDIMLGANQGGTVGATILWQRFSQDVSVPDGGATVLMLGLVLTGIAAVRRKLA